jgi:transposase-like protein
MSKPYKKKLAPFVAIFRHTIKTPAWRALSVGARATFFALKTNYNTNAQNAVFLSARDGARELGVHKDTARKWLRELEHYGDGAGRAPWLTWDRQGGSLSADRLSLRRKASDLRFPELGRRFIRTEKTKPCPEKPDTPS